jgi:RNA polymerase sigma factor (sigma-70 family)
MTKGASSTILQLIRSVALDQRVRQLSDHELLWRFTGQGDEAAFHALLLRHGPMVLEVCRGVLGNEADAEDAFQATFLILARKAASIRKTASVGSWLHGVAYRTAIKARAQSATRRKTEACAPARPNTEPDDLTWREVRQVLHEELTGLAERYRAPLVACYLEGKTQDEAAALLGVAKTTLKERLERARSLLRARLVRRGLGPAAVLLTTTWPSATASACLSATLVSTTVKAASLFAAGQTAAASVISVKVAALTEGVLKTMFVTKLKIATAVLVAAVLVVIGIGAVSFPVLQAQERPDLSKTQFQPDVKKDKEDATARPARSLPGHKERVTSVAYSPDGRWVATAAWDGTARVWDAQTGKEERCLNLRGYVNQIVFSPDNEFVVVAHAIPVNAQHIIVLKWRTGEQVHEFPDSKDPKDHCPLFCAALSPDGKYLACGGQETTTNAGADIRLYEFATGKLVRAFRGQQFRIDALTFSPDGKTLFSEGPLPRPKGNTKKVGGDLTIVRVWDVATGKERDVATGKERYHGFYNNKLVLVCLAPSPDGRTLAHANGSDITLRETATGGERAKLTGHIGDVRRFAISPDGRTLASAGEDGTVRLWDLPSGKEVGRLEGHDDVYAVAFSPDGKTLVSGGLDNASSGDVSKVTGNAHIWDVSKITGRPRAVAERSPADLEADWKDLGGDAMKGYAALGRLVAASASAVPYLGKQLQDTKPVDAKRVERLIADLDDNQYSVREQATKELGALGDRVMPAIKKALAGAPSAEANRRLGALLDQIVSTGPSAETIREIRVVEALESIGTPEAHRLLDKLAAGPAETRLTQEAKAAAGRLAKRPNVTK